MHEFQNICTSIIFRRPRHKELTFCPQLVSSSYVTAKPWRTASFAISASEMNLLVRQDKHRQSNLLRHYQFYPLRQYTAVPYSVLMTQHYRLQHAIVSRYNESMISANVILGHGKV